MANKAEAAREALQEKIAELAAETSSASVVLKLAEAFAWTYQPNNSHGGGASD